MPEKDSRILILGGGFGGLFTALDLTGAGEVTLVSDEDHFLFKPMLYEYLSGEVEAWHIAPEFKELLEENVRVTRGIATGIDLQARRVDLAGGKKSLNYDVLVLALGAVTNYWNVDGAERFTLPFRTIANANQLRRRMTEALDHIQPDSAPQDTRSALTFAVVGGGASGVELSTKMADLLRDAVKRTKRILQVGPNGTASDSYWVAHEAIKAGRIGKVTWAHASYNRNARICLFNEHQKIDPTAGPDKSGEDYIDWNMWLGHQWGLAPKIPWTPEHFFREPTQERTKLFLSKIL